MMDEPVNPRKKYLDPVEEKMPYADAEDADDFEDDIFDGYGEEEYDSEFEDEIND